MIVELTKTVSFEAAHRLPMVPAGHKCGRLHGHSYHVAITVKGPVRADGFLIDYDDIHAAWAPLHEMLDHRYLNDLPGLENPTTEHLARVIWRELAPHMPLHAVAIQETCTERCTYYGPQA